MKKIFGLLALAVMTLGIVSCEAETSIEETESLFETIDVQVDQDSVDGAGTVEDPRN
nr:hypothetical protein [Allomuricauda sp.]